MKQFLKDLAERAVKTFVQALVANIAVGEVGLGEIDWGRNLSVAAVATLASVAMSICSYRFGEEGTASLVSEAEK